MDGQISAPPSQRNIDLSTKLVGSIHIPQQWYVVPESSSKKRLVEEFDWLGELPVDIQREILCLLSTTDAARTGFTSRAWSTTWKSIPKLVFELDQFPGRIISIPEQRRNFERFVNHALVCHDKSDVKVFELWLWTSIEYRSLIHIKWIRFAIKHNVKKLVLFGKMARNRKIPESLFSSKYIVKMELAIENYLLTWSEACTLPNLRKLKLKFLIFDPASPRDLFSCCPALEKLSLMFCDMPRSQNLHVSSPTLAEFVMCYCRGMGDCSLSFQTPLSKFIWISGEGNAMNLVPTQFGLVIAAQEIRLHIQGNNLTSSVIKVTKELFKANTLVFDSWLVRILSMADDLPRQLKVDAFCNMSELTIRLFSEIANFRAVVLLISKCVCVSCVRLELEGSSSGIVDYPALNLYLRTYGSRRGFCQLIDIRITNFEGSPVEMMPVRLLLAHAHRLQSMHITSNELMLTHMMERLLTILSYHKASPAALVTVR